MNIINPNIELASVVRLVLEFDDQGSIVPSYRIKSFDLYQFDEISIGLLVAI